MNIKFIKPYKAIQQGFTWKDIPNFAIITGVNGAGKTQLLEEMGKNDTDVVSVTDDEGKPEIIIARNDNANTQSVEKLVEYKNSYINRSAQQKSLEENIERHKHILNRYLNEIKAINDDIVKQRKQNDINKERDWIKRYSQELQKLFEYSYECELKEISARIGKEPKDLTDEEVRLYANPYFTSLTEIGDFEKYVEQEKEKRNELCGLLGKDGKYDEMVNEAKKEYSFNIINSYFIEFGFSYFRMQDPFGRDTKHKGKIWFKGQNNEEVEFGDLSSGEQMIVKFVFWTLGKDFRGNRINTMLLDEPDRSLHPSMCKMMVDILYKLSKPKDEGGSGIRIIITTHSPSTVAFAPEDSLFVMEKNEKNERSIRNVSTSEAEDVLSEGILTYRKSIDILNYALISEHQNLLFVEGKTDVIHLKRAMEVLNISLDVEILALNGASNLGSFIKITPSEFFGNKKMIALFDLDKEGKSEYNSIKGNEVLEGVKKLNAAHSNGLAYALTLSSSDTNLSAYCPIEFLYPQQYLEDNSIMSKISYQEFIKNYGNISNNNEVINELTREFNEGLTLRSFKVKDDEKTSFAEKIKTETDPNVFEGFRKTLELIKQIIELQ